MTEPEVLDLTQAAPARHVRLSETSIGALGIGELLEVARLTGHPYDQLAGILRKRGGDAALAAVALAYVLARRVEPEATWEEAQRWIVEIVPPDPLTPDPRRRIS